MRAGQYTVLTTAMKTEGKRTVTKISIKEAATERNSSMVNHIRDISADQVMPHVRCVGIN